MNNIGLLYLSGRGVERDEAEAKSWFAKAAALGVRNGCDLDCGKTYGALVPAVREGLVRETEIDRALVRLLLARYRLKFERRRLTSRRSVI